jgi:hypothetical protein
MWKRGVALMVVLSSLAGAGRAEDPPPDAGKPALSWSVRVTGGLAASRDGTWLAANTSDGLQLFPTAGGKPVTLPFPEDERPGQRCAFTADSKWLVVPGEANSVEVKGIPKDRTQALYLFPTAAPTKRKTIQVKLKAEGLDREVKQFLDPEFRNMKTLAGAVTDVSALAGSRVLLDRGTLGVEIWDAASASKVSAPPSIEARWCCGIAGDGSRCVVSNGPMLEIRDLKSNRATATIRVGPDGDGSDCMTTHPRFTRRDADVVATCTSLATLGSVMLDPAADTKYALRCWSVADGTKRWEARLGAARYVTRVDEVGPFVAVLLGQTLRIVDAADGSLPAHELQGMRVAAAAPSADGKAMWVADESGLRRVALPEAKPK